MTTKATDRFVMSVISLAFALKNLVESKYYDEGQHKLVQDFAKLKERVQFQTKLLEQRQDSQKIPGTTEEIRVKEESNGKHHKNQGGGRSSEALKV